ncbi:MAG: OmpA family protein [Vulcanibacillus sp.]
MKRILCAVLSIIAATALFGANAKSTDIIGVPSSDILGNGELNLSFYNSISMKPTEDKVGFDYNLSLSYGILDFMDIAIHMYTYKDYALQIQTALLKEKKHSPAITFGIKNITYQRYIDEGGGGSTVNSGLADYAYANRSSDILSAYLAMTKDFGGFGKYTLGIGRGEFIGYGRGRYLSSVAFFDATDLTGSIANEFMFGFFFGGELPVTKNFSLKADVDGRDVNAGMQFNWRELAVNAAITHLELFTATDPNLRPRVEVGINYTFDLMKKSAPEMPKNETKTGKLTMLLASVEDEEPLDGVVEFVNAPLSPVFVGDGKKTVELPEGRYTVRVKSDEFITLTREVQVKAGEETTVYFDMEAVLTSGIVTGRIVDKTTEEAIIPNLEISGVDKSKINVDVQTGIFTVELMPGTYTMYAKKDNYIDWIQPIAVENGKTLIQNIYMLKKGGRVSLKNVNFESGKADLTKTSYPILDEAVQLLKANSEVEIEIQGFTDDVGKADANLVLSQKRAETVKSYLVQKGIAENRIKTKGFGEAMNITDNETKEHRAINRRIEFIILNK